MNKIVTIILFGCFSLVSMFAQNALAPNLKHCLMSHDECKSRTTGSTYHAYLLVNDTFDVASLEDLGVKVNLRTNNILTVEANLSQLGQLGNWPSVKYVQLSDPVAIQLDNARREANINKIHLGEGFLQSYTGNGVVIGVIDAGFDYTHPNFFSRNGEKFRVSRVWEQDNQQGTPPDGFSYGTELKTYDEIFSAKGDVSIGSHATHVAGIASGSCVQNDWYGVAYDADLVFVSISSNESLTKGNVNVSDAIAYVFSYAQSQGKPCVINMSLGTQVGPHDGTSLFDKVADGLQGEGLLLVGSSGNFGNGKIHVGHTITDDSLVPLKTFIDFVEKPNANSKSATVDIWGEAGMQYEVQLCVYNYSSGSEVQISDKLLVSPTSSGTTNTFELTKSSKGTVLMTSEINPLNGKSHALLTLDVKSLRANHAIGLILIPKTAGEIHAWADYNRVRFTDNSVPGWTDGDVKHTIGEIGGTASGVLSVGAYTSRDYYIDIDTSNKQTTGEELGQLASFSSCGPTIDGRMKPDIVAPGTYIISSLSSHDVANSHPIAGYVTKNDKQYPFGYMQGTSMSAPLVTGIMATWLEAFPSLRIETVREILGKTSLKDEFTGVLTVGNSQWGLGKVDAYQGLKELFNHVDVVHLNACSKKVAISFEKLDIHCLFSDFVSRADIIVSDLYGKTIYQSNATHLNPGNELEIPFSNQPKGVYVIKIIADGMVSSFKIIR